MYAQTKEENIIDRLERGLITDKQAFAELARHFEMTPLQLRDKLREERVKSRRRG